MILCDIIYPEVLEYIILPIAHGEGRYIASDEVIMILSEKIFLKYKIIRTVQ